MITEDLLDQIQLPQLLKKTNNVAIAKIKLLQKIIIPRYKLYRQRSEAVQGFLEFFCFSFKTSQEAALV